MVKGSCREVERMKRKEKMEEKRQISSLSINN